MLLDTGKYPRPANPAAAQSHSYTHAEKLEPSWQRVKRPIRREGPDNAVCTSGGGYGLMLTRKKRVTKPAISVITIGHGKTI